MHTRPPVRPAVRLRAAPPLDPPFDDELLAAGWLGGEEQVTLPEIRTAAAGRRRPDPRGPRPRSAAPGPAPIPPEALATATPEARRAANRFTGTCLEIINGYRPVAHIRPLVSPGDASTISEQLANGVRRMTGPHRRNTRVAPTSNQVRLRRLRVCEPRSGVAEAAAALDSAGRTWAIAFRLEHRRGSWVGTALQVL